MRLRIKVIFNRSTVQIVAGISIWYLIVTVVLLFRYQNVFNLSGVPYFRPVIGKGQRVGSQESLIYTDRNLVFVGVMTANEFLRTRVVAANNTWARTFPGKVVFFTSETTDGVYLSGIEVVALRGVTNVSSAQKKAFLMLKYMYDHHIDDFRFFTRAVDDTYIKSDALTKFLHSVNSRISPVIGSTDQRMKGDSEKLGIHSGENYCMGGPGMVIPQEILRKTGPNIKYCLKNMVSAWEDVELGRCFKRVANASCTWAYENIFYHNYKDENVGFNHSLNGKEIHDALTLHPVKAFPFTYRLHQHLLNFETSKLYRRLQSLRREVDVMDNLLTSNHPDSRSSVSSKDEQRTGDDIAVWSYIVEYLHFPFIENPQMVMPVDGRIGLNETARKINENMSAKSHLHGIKGSVDNFTIIYSRVDKLRGQDYIFNISKEIWDPHKARNIKHCRLLRAHRPFLPVEMTAKNVREATVDIGKENTISSTGQIRVNVIISLAGRYPVFLRFMKNFEDRLLKTNQSVSLLIMLFRNFPNDTSDDVSDYIERLQRNYSDVTLGCKLMEGKFSRGRAFQTAVQAFRDDDLLFFADIDLILEMSTLQRVRLNTKRGESVYAPIFFSEYDPSALPRRRNPATTYYDSDNGYWRKYSFGMVSCYKSDFMRTGGYRLDIEGWGLEDNDLMDKIVASGIAVFRSVDVGLVHTFHPIMCDRKLHIDQLNMCIGTMYNSLASREVMTDFIYRTSDILNLSRLND